MSDPFAVWLKRHLHEVVQGTAIYNGQSISPTTQVVHYHYVTSFLVVTITHRTETLICDSRRTVADAILWSIVSLACGWWAVPWGPIATIRALVSNLTGGDRCRVSDLIAELTGHSPADDCDLVTLTSSAAELARKRMRLGGFPPETVLSITASHHAPPEYSVRFDLPETDGRFWLGESEGLGILVHKQEAERVKGLMIDACDDEFVFHRPDFGLRE